MNYQIITNLEALKEFIEWLPATTEEEMFYFALFARSKYTKDQEGKNGIPHIKSDKAQLKRGTATKDRLLSKIRQLECPLGSYMQKDIVIPQEALALYINPNPRNLWTATKNSLKHFAEVVCTNGRTMNPQADAMSEIQKARGTSHFVIADIDTKHPMMIGQIEDMLANKDGYRILETRGGYHVIIDPKKQSNTQPSWYMKIKQHSECDQIGDLMIPVPGTYQGGFTPKFIN